MNLKRSTAWAWLDTVRRARERPLTAYYILLGASALLLTVGLIMVLSASSVWSYRRFDGDSYAVVKRQLTWVLIGIPSAFVASRLPVRVIRALAWPALLVAVVLLALTTTSLGVTRNQQTNWLALGPVDVQPSEIAKLAVILWAASVYANKERMLGTVHHILIPVMIPGMLTVIGLVLWQGDLGTALVLFAIALAMLWIVGTPAKLFWLSLTGVGVVVLLLAATDQERLSRLTSFTDPFRDFANSGWQPAHGLLALSSGGVFGQGIGASQQKWGTLPEAHTDFIFAVLGEELGLAGTLLVVALFLAIAYAATTVAMGTKDPFVRYASFGVVVWLLGQMIINVGMVLALLPVIGIPLPLVSYGGSALVPSLVALGLVIGFARREPGAARALAARRRRRPIGLSTRRAR
ncbi:MAG: putative lipid II flippase FtsW [Nocardioides sp.]